MFRSPSDIADLFSMLHDGVVASFRLEDTTLQLEVEIPYLTQRIDPNYRFFRVALVGVQTPLLETWPKEQSAPPELISRWEEILNPPPDILSGEIKNGRIHITLNQPAVECAHCGGTLEVSIESVAVYDESGKSYTPDELKRLCTEYWQDWSSKK